MVNNQNGLSLDYHNILKNNTYSFPSRYFSPSQGVGCMGKIISVDRKRTGLSFIRENFSALSQREIARRLGIGKTAVNNWSKELGLAFQKHTVNESFFQELNEMSSYVLGYIYADGNIAWNPEKGYQSLTITAAEKDKSHLECIRNELESTKPLLYSPKTKSYRLIVCNKFICQNLMALGVFPRKSLTVAFPQFLSREQLPHFLRGVIDGDGNVRYVKRDRSPYFEITIASGSKQFCDGFVEAVQQMTGISANIRKVGKHTYVIQYSCSRGKKLANFIYSSASLFLERKNNEYKKCLEAQHVGEQ